MKKSLQLKFLGTFMIVALGMLCTLALAHKTTVISKPPAIKLPVKKAIAYDPELLHKYGELYRLYDTIRSSYTMAGVINLDDPSDSTANMKDAAFFFSRNGNDFYYKLGATITLNMRGLYVYIDEKGRNIVIGAQKNVIADQVPGAFTSLSKNLAGEGYTLSGQLNGQQQTLIITNEHHLSCKQLSLTYHTLNMHISRIYARLTNLSSIVKKDKTLDVVFSQWEADAEPGNYMSPDDIVRRENGKWIAVKQYKGFSIINL